MSAMHACTFTLPQHTEWLCFLAKGVADPAWSCGVARLAGSAFPARPLRQDQWASLRRQHHCMHSRRFSEYYLQLLYRRPSWYATSFTHVRGDHALCRPSFPNAAPLYIHFERSMFRLATHPLNTSAGETWGISLAKSSPEIERRRSQAHCWVELFSLLGARFLCWTALWIRRPCKDFLRLYGRWSIQFNHADLRLYIIPSNFHSQCIPWPTILGKTMFSHVVGPLPTISARLRSALFWYMGSHSQLYTLWSSNL
jgi:hypothetical protein